MDYTIGAFDPISKSVPVTFTKGGEEYPRAVNAALRDGAYDPVGTEERVQEVGLGMEAKVAAGVIRSVSKLEAIAAELTAQAEIEAAAAKAAAEAAEE
jgi:hypothetical protein